MPGLGAGGASSCLFLSVGAHSTQAGAPAVSHTKLGAQLRKLGQTGHWLLPAPRKSTAGLSSPRGVCPGPWVGCVCNWNLRKGRRVRRQVPAAPCCHPSLLLLLCKREPQLLAGARPLVGPWRMSVVKLTHRGAGGAISVPTSTSLSAALGTGSCSL